MDNEFLPQELLNDLAQLCVLAQHALPGEPIPCFGHMRVETAGRTRDLLLGWRTVTDGPVTILNWQTSPLAAVFFSTREGEDYEIDVGDRTVEGTLLSRHLLTFAHGEIVTISAENTTFSKLSDGSWSRAERAHEALLQPRKSDRPKLPPPWTTDALDPVQRAAVELPAARALLVVGEAGCGKTTVALHRVAVLQRAAKREGRDFRALVLVPTEGIRRLSERLLERYGAVDVEIKVFERWAAIQARRAFPGIPRREYKDSSLGVMRLKRHAALRAEWSEVVGPKRKRPTATREDLLNLFGDRLLLERVAHASNGSITADAVAQMMEHTRVQFTETTEEEFEYVDADRLQTVDGLLIDSGTPMESAGTIDPEDYAVLFAIAARRALPKHPAPSPTQYDCVVLDEAQEFAPLELELIGRAVNPGGTLIVSGDEGQQVDPSACFLGWNQSMDELRARSYETVRLAVSYRCPAPVTQLARAVLDETLTKPLGDNVINTDIIASFRAPLEFHLFARLIDDLHALRTNDPTASIAVILRTPESALRFAKLLCRGIDVHFANDGDFRFVAGIEVACVAEVKGLEFDYVIVPDVGASVYHDDRESRRALYVAVTRASQQLILASATSWSTIVRDSH